MCSLLLRLTILLFTFSWGVMFSNLLAPHLQVEVPSEVKTGPVIVPVAATRSAPSEPATVVNNAPSPMIILDYSDKFVPDGGYLLLGKKPKQFKDFEYLYIETYLGKDGHLIGSAIIGSSTEKLFTYQSAVFLLVTEKRLVLVTEPNALGFEYRFDGEFLRGGVVADTGEGKAVLKGTLTKSQNGRRIAEAAVKFQIEQHGC